MTDEIEEEGAGDEPIILHDGEIYIWDPAALLDEYQADAIQYRDGTLYVLKEKSRQWVRVDPIKPKQAAKVREIRGDTDGAK